MQTSVNNQTLGEEIANAISHGIGELLSVAGAAVAIVYACFVSDAIGIVSSSIYGFSLILLYAVSTIYHSLANNRAKTVFRILDHCSIFVLILGTDTPVYLSLIRGALGWTLFGITTALTALGIVLNSIDLKKFTKISMILYVLMGWMVVVAFWQMMKIVPAKGIALLVAGGICYTIGIIFYKMKKTKFMHSVWHLFVLGGSVLHYFFVLFYALPIK
ncbi:MAG: hemolysin III family protein [Oscillospiraceae bacterium]|nr:hemolysin III family protein [Oscillospiraceae bacterium]